MDCPRLLACHSQPVSTGQAARAFLEHWMTSSEVVIAEPVLVEFYLALRHPAIMAPPLDPAGAVAECGWFRAHPHWALAESADVMEPVWRHAVQPDFACRRIIDDARLARTLLAHRVTEFATANVKDFQGFGFARIWNPLESAQSS